MMRVAWPALSACCEWRLTVSRKRCATSPISSSAAFWSKSPGAGAAPAMPFHPTGSHRQRPPLQLPEKQPPTIADENPFDRYHPPRTGKRCRAFSIGRLDSLRTRGGTFSPLRPFDGSLLAQPRQSSIACASAPLASLWLVQLAPSGGLRPALTTGLMGRADFSP